MGNRSIELIFCTREFFNAVPPIQESMPKNALEDLTICLHYSDDWECKDDWDDIYGEVSLNVTFFECIAEVRVSPNSLGIEYKIIPSS
jgi:hypothetical protein